MRRNTNKKSILISILFVGMMACMLSGCKGKKASSVKIIYTNDIHSYIDNEAKDGDGNVTGDGLRLSKVAAMVKDLKSNGENVALVDAGDTFQGDIYGAIDNGESMLNLMNSIGYDVATPGNHDFDYGVIQFLKLRDEAKYTYVSCNFHSTNSREIVLPDSTIVDLNGTKIAFIGVTTPEAITSSTPVYFQDENGEFIYTVEGMKNPEDLYVSVQNAIDNVKGKADYIIALGHVGVGIDEKNNKISSIDIINNTSGLNAFIDGHSHTTLEGELIKDKDGKDVVLTQTGSYLNNVGVMTIDADGNITTKLESDYEREEESVAKIENEIIQNVADKMGEKIGTLDSPLYVSNPENPNQRLIRAIEMNAGDFVADSVYWYFNQRIEIPCDIAFQNGGGVRAGIEKGDLTYQSAKTVEPFGNMVCLISTTGQEIIDALEMGVGSIGIWDDEWDAPAENGGFMQVAGLKYSIDASIKSSVETDDNGMFKGVSSDYKVKNVQVYNREKGVYEPIDANKTYTLGGINYLLRNSGNGLSMFEDDELVVDYVGQDYTILSEYIKSFTMNGEYSQVNTKNSPLSAYDGYLIDYENPFGCGRITIENIKYPEGKLNIK